MKYKIVICFLVFPVMVLFLTVYDFVINNEFQSQINPVPSEVVSLDTKNAIISNINFEQRSEVVSRDNYNVDNFARFFNLSTSAPREVVSLEIFLILFFILIMVTLFYPGYNYLQQKKRFGI